MRMPGRIWHRERGGNGIRNWRFSPRCWIQEDFRFFPPPALADHPARRRPPLTRRTPRTTACAVRSPGRPARQRPASPERRERVERRGRRESPAERGENDQAPDGDHDGIRREDVDQRTSAARSVVAAASGHGAAIIAELSLIHISEPTRQAEISY